VSIWRRQATLTDLTEASRGTLVEHLGIEFVEIGPDFIRGTMPVDQRTVQPMRILHGGASVVLAETLGSTAANLCVERAGTVCVGQEINANHVRSAHSGRVTGTARAVHLGGRSQVWSIEIVNEAGQLVCLSRLTIAVIAAPAGSTPPGPTPGAPKPGATD
jgi:uncharacterized protein (TIGR00369 family)